MKPERLDRRIRLERATVTQDPGSGENVEAWAELATVWASRRRASARETLAAAEISAEVTDVFEIRWDSLWSSLNPTDRIVFEERIYDIATVDEIGRREGWRIAASARADSIPVDAIQVLALDFRLPGNSQWWPLFFEEHDFDFSLDFAVTGNSQFLPLLEERA